MPNTTQSAGAGEQHHDETALAADAREFAATLEETHPDPYDGHGGRVPFHRHLETLVREIPDGGESATAFARRLQSFAARVRDGHTKVEGPASGAESLDDRLPLAFRVVGDALYVEAAYGDAHADLVGGRLCDVAGVSVPELRERMARTQSSDNEYGDRYRLTDALGPNPANLRPIVDTPTPTVTVETPAGDRVTRMLSLTDAEEPVERLTQSLEHPDSNGEPAYRLLDDGQAALLAIPDCVSHREPIEAAAAMYESLPDIYDPEDIYRQVVGDSVPDNREDVIAGIPAATDVFASLVEAMADAGTETLVIDTRGNSGGSSIPAYLLTYVLHGRDGVAEAAADQYSVGKDSALYREHYGDAGQLRDTENPAGFDFHSYERYRDGGESDVLTELAEMSDTIADELASNAHEAYYCPEDVVVVTDAETFSAGVEPGILLEKLGASVVGVPSAQAANGPRDVLSSELPETGLQYRVSYRHHVFQPGVDGTVFRPDVELTPERFERYGRAADAEVALAFDHSDGKKGASSR
jgi:hypothetical protein